MPPEVKVRLSVEGTPEALAAFRSVQQQAQSSGRAAAAGMAPLNASLSAMKSLLGQLGLAAGLAATVGKTVNEVREAVEIADKLGETAERLTTAVKAFVPLALQAKTDGVELDALEQKMARFAKQLWELRAGNPEVVAAFRAIGLSAKSFDGLDLAQSFTVSLRALGSLRDSYQKSAVAQLVFSKGAEDLIPLANDVAQNGLDPLKVKIGELFGERNIANIRSTRDELDLLNYALKGIVVSGIGPFFIGQAENVRLLTSTLIELNEVAEKFTHLAPFMSGAWRGFASWLVPVRMGIEKAHQELREFGLEVQKFYEISKFLARGDVAGARRAELIAEAKLMASQAVHAEKLKEIWDSAGPPAAASLARHEPPEPPPPKKPRPAGSSDALLKESEQADLQAAQAHNAMLEAEAKASYDAGLGSLRAYYAARRDAIRENEAAELDLLTAEWERAQKIQDPAKRATALKTIDARTQELLDKADQQRTEVDAWYVEERTKLETRLAAIADKRRAAEEQEHQSKLREIDEIQEAERKALVGLSPDTDAARAQAAAQAQTDADSLRRAEEFRYQLAGARTELETLVGAGPLTPEDQARFEALAGALERMAQAIGPEAIKAVGDFRGELKKGGESTRELTDYGQAVESSLTGAFSRIGTEIKSASDLLRQFLLLLVQAVGQAAVTRLATSLVSHIPGLSTVKKARGGSVYGPGTGTSDSILGWLSNREYVQTAARMGEPGALPFMEYFRERGFLPALRWALDSAPHLAGGGSAGDPVAPLRFNMAGPRLELARSVADAARARAGAGAGAASGVELSGQITLVLPPGVEASWEGREAGRKLIRLVHANRRSINRVLENQ